MSNFSDALELHEQCRLKRSNAEDGTMIEGHTFKALPAYRLDARIYLPLQCQHCGLKTSGWVADTGQSAALIEEKYGHELRINQQ